MTSSAANRRAEAAMAHMLPGMARGKPLPPFLQPDRNKRLPFFLPHGGTSSLASSGGCVQVDSPRIDSSIQRQWIAILHQSSNAHPNSQAGTQGSSNHVAGVQSARFVAAVVYGHSLCKICSC
jgi:hypothetical protein